MNASYPQTAHPESLRRPSPAIRRRVATGLLVAALHGPTAAIGIAYTETGDAGDTAATASAVIGVGALGTIDGAIASALDVDVFRIAIVDAAAFSATTDGPTTINTILALFDATGRGVYLNDANTSGVSSTLPAGHPFGPAVPGIYHLAVMSNPVNPLSGGVAMLGALDTTAGFPVFRLNGRIGDSNP